MKATVLQALHYESLVHASRGSEKQALQAFEKLQTELDTTQPLLLHIDRYAAILGVKSSVVSDAYYHCRTAFEQMDDSVVVLDRSSPHWPKQIDSFAYRPMFLYVQGNLGLLKEPSVSVIGTRSPSLEGKELALQTSRALGKAGYVVASGLALGIDGVAHKAALAMGNPTIAVIGTPLCSVYPPEHELLQQQIAQCGAVVSRFAPSTKTQKWHFLLRNRLMSALSLASVVVEDRDGGGAVRQATFALEQKRYIFIYQGSVDNHSILWPRQFANKSRVFVIHKSGDIPRVLAQAMKRKASVGKPKDAFVQLQLFS